MLYLKGYTREPTLNHNFLLAIFLSYKLCYQGMLIYLETSHLKGYLMGNPIYVFYNPLAYLAQPQPHTSGRLCKYSNNQDTYIKLMFILIIAKFAASRSSIEGLCTIPQCPLSNQLISPRDPNPNKVYSRLSCSW